MPVEGKKNFSFVSYAGLVEGTFLVRRAAFPWSVHISATGVIDGHTNHTPVHLKQDINKTIPWSKTAKAAIWK